MISATAGMILLGVLYFIYYTCTKRPKSVVYFENSKFIDCQSVITDQKTGTRSSVRSFNDIPETRISKLFDAFITGRNISGESNCFGIRNSFDEPVRWMTYTQVEEQIRYIGSALSILTKGMDLNEENFIGICARNSPQYMIFYLSCMAYSFVVVPIYATYGEESLTYILEETQTKILICDTVDQTKNLMRLIKHKINLIIIINPENNHELSNFGNHYDVQVQSFEQLKNLGQSNIQPYKFPKEEELFTICHTSGSTGFPKGVMVTHKSIIRSFKALVSSGYDFGLLQCDTFHLSYLPLAHMMEQLFIMFCLIQGAPIGFITEDIKSLARDLQEYKPTVLSSVPRVLGRIYTEVGKKIKQKSSVLWMLCEKEIKKKVEEQKKGIYRNSGPIDYFIFRKIRERFGGKVQFIVTSSAPIDKNVKDFIRGVFGCPIIEAYGSTETLGSLSVTLNGDFEYGSVGALTYGVEVKLIDVPEMDWIVSRDGIGEICVRSNCLMDGYYKNEQGTREAIDSNNFFHMGDVGMWTPNGALKIVDRIKNIFKLSQGEYISPEQLESAYLNCSLIDCIYIDGNPLKSFPVAVVVPNFPELYKQAAVLIANIFKTNKETEVNHDKLCKNKQIRQFIVEEMNKIGRFKGLFGFQLVRTIYLTEEPFSIANELLTVTMKHARFNLRKKFAAIVNDLYAEYETEFQD